MNKLSLHRPKRSVKSAKPRSWACQECGKTFCARAAEKAMLSAEGCPGCGSADIAILPRDTTARQVAL